MQIPLHSGRARRSSNGRLPPIMGATLSAAFRPRNPKDFPDAQGPAFPRLARAGRRAAGPADHPAQPRAGRPATPGGARRAGASAQPPAGRPGVLCQRGESSGSGSGQPVHHQDGQQALPPPVRRPDVPPLLRRQPAATEAHGIEPRLGSDHERGRLPADQQPRDRWRRPDHRGLARRPRNHRPVGRQRPGNRPGRAEDRP